VIDAPLTATIVAIDQALSVDNDNSELLSS